MHREGNASKDPVLSIPKSVHDKTDDILKGTMTRHDFFKSSSIKLTMSNDFVWSYLVRKFPRWFIDITSKNSTAKDLLLKIEYLEQFKKEILKFKIK